MMMTNAELRQRLRTMAEKLTLAGAMEQEVQLCLEAYIDLEDDERVPVDAWWREADVLAVRPVS